MAAEDNRTRLPNGRWKMASTKIPSSILQPQSSSQLVFALGEKQLPGAVEIRFGHQDIRQAIQVAVVRQGGIHKFLRGGDAVFFQHHHQQFRFDDLTGVKNFHSGWVTKFTNCTGPSKPDLSSGVPGLNGCHELQVNRFVSASAASPIRRFGHRFAT